MYTIHTFYDIVVNKNRKYMRKYGKCLFVQISRVDGVIDPYSLIVFLCVIISQAHLPRRTTAGAASLQTIFNNK